MSVFCVAGAVALVSTLFVITRASADSDSSTLKSDDKPLNACIRIACHFCRTSVV